MKQRRHTKIDEVSSFDRTTIINRFLKEGAYKGNAKTNQMALSTVYEKFPNAEFWRKWAGPKFKLNSFMWFMSKDGLDCIQKGWNEYFYNPHDGEDDNQTEASKSDKEPDFTLNDIFGVKEVDVQKSDDKIENKPIVESKPSVANKPKPGNIIGFIK